MRSRRPRRPCSGRGIGRSARIYLAQRRLIAEELLTAPQNTKPQYSNRLNKLNVLIREEQSRRSDEDADASVVAPLKRKPGTAPATDRRPLSQVARHVVAPVDIVASEWPSVRQTCHRLGWSFDGWQDGAGMLILAQNAAGEYAADTIVISIPRQVGKTFLIGAILFALCLMKPGLRVIWTAQVKDTALGPSSSS